MQKAIPFNCNPTENTSFKSAIYTNKLYGQQFIIFFSKAFSIPFKNQVQLKVTYYCGKRTYH